MCLKKCALPGMGEPARGASVAARLNARQRETMRAGLRLAMVSLAAGLSLGAAPALAQSAQQPPANPPPSDTIGPRELQNFSLSGTVTQPAQGPVQTRPARRSSRTAAAPPSTADVAASVSEP